MFLKTQSEAVPSQTVLLVKFWLSQANVVFCAKIHFEAVYSMFFSLIWMTCQSANFHKNWLSRLNLKKMKKKVFFEIIRMNCPGYTQKSKMRVGCEILETQKIFPSTYVTHKTTYVYLSPFNWTVGISKKFLDLDLFWAGYGRFCGGFLSFCIVAQSNQTCHSFYCI